MPADKAITNRCAIYTRKSSEEGLDQSFNSLDAQREACLAYVESQRHEGWRAVATHYDDGGFSGGSMERPALKQLLADISAGKINTVVVYKVDRLTRSLADFAKIVEAFDAKGISFVSVTQQFNTTSSMGRLTLNVLLSFAQFEREVTGERIRDKFAASKRKGMWMGGKVPLGYVLRERKLYIEPEQAKEVIRLYNRYLELGCVSKLKVELDAQGVKTVVRLCQNGVQYGGCGYARGYLYRLLQNRLYLGEIRHKDVHYPGEHEAILSQALFDQVQAKLLANATHDREFKRLGAQTGLLTGIIVDEAGKRFCPVMTNNKRGRRYRYYATPEGAKSTLGGKQVRIQIPAYDLEGLVANRIRAFLSSSTDLLDALRGASGHSANRAAKANEFLQRAKHHLADWDVAAEQTTRGFLVAVLRQVRIFESKVEVLLDKARLRAALSEPGESGSEDPDVSTAERDTATSQDTSENAVTLPIEAKVARCGKELRLIVPLESQGELPQRPPVPALLTVLARAHSWYHRLLAGEVRNQVVLAQECRYNASYVGRVLRCNFLAPDIVEAILDGKQPPTLTVEQLLNEQPLSMDWAEQRRQLGFAV